ncbi:Cyclin-like [Sesbania bispinosa]|nr:Cyclin-like [Sesbania bispinosa]
MKKVNTFCAKEEGRPLRITRARARALGGIPPYSRPSFNNDQKNLVRPKRAAASENKSSLVVPDDALQHHKRRAVLTDVTNICTKPHDKCIEVSQFQARGVCRKKDTKLASDVSIEVSSSQQDVRAKLTEELSTIRMVESNDTIAAATLVDKEPKEHCMSNSIREHVIEDTAHSTQESVQSDELLISPNKDIDVICEKLGASDCLAIVDIDSELKDSQIWSSYAPDIYNKNRVTEIERKPLAHYMDKLQQDITPNMRGILIDWLVEVSEEYNLVPDTLYLTVNLIDRFLSTSLVQKQRLQLVGVTCMLVASKYEEICAPRVEEFCFITDNTYTKEEVLKMESEVLNLLHFQLSVPTAKTFLRRFIQAAQSSYKVPRVELEFLANYLAELTLVEYSFLQFLPSLVAASAVFLARWTLNHSEHPWNPTLEHYTNYKASQLKTVVLALEDLQLNTKGCSLNAIREKYKQQKFNCVAKLSPKPVQSLFQVQV